MKKFLLSEIVYGILLTVLVLLSYTRHGSFLETLELKFYDVRSQMRQPSANALAKEIALITIDDDSLGKLGRWPWPRSRIAELLNFLNTDAAKPKVIGLDIIFSEPEQNQGMAAIEKLNADFTNQVAAKETELNHERAQYKQKPSFALTQQIKLRAKLLEGDKQFLENLKTAQTELDQDSKLGTAISAAHNVVLPIFFQLGAGLAGKPKDLAPSITKSSLSAFGPESGAPINALQSFEATVPLPRFAEAAIGIGHVNTSPDFDGTIRKEPLVILYSDQSYPSFALEIVRHYLGLKSEEVSLTLGKEVVLGKAVIPLDEASHFSITYNGPERSFPYYPFYDVAQGKVAPEAFKDKIVIVGPTAAGVGTTYTTTVTHNFPAIEVVANVIDNLIHKRFLTRPSWAWIFELGLILFMGLFISLVLPKLKAMPGAVISLTLLIVILGAGTYLFISQDQWLKVSYPAILLAAGYTVVVSKRFLVTERGKELVEASAIETNKMLGLSFQGQGMLDLSFEKFRKCPVDDSMKELLYNLGLDFERKRQFNKAVAVYEHIATKDKNYKDVAKKIDVLKKASEGAVMGGPIGGKSKDATIMVEGASVAATLGRYEIIKELGKGAMGIVYLGRDPKINRQVAIKTMRFEDDVDQTAMKAVKERFFREAESAGNLSHPHIVKIYDAGEEQDVSYIAMELLEGEDLKKFTTKDNLLPIPKVAEYVAIIAEALDYAHKQGVVHRDIKPANIMFLKDSTLRVTDFGIARIQASSKTATGAVMGTPSYMSPEQIAGKKVNGRSDLFSLGVVLFEFLTGEKPWKGGDSVGTLLFQIASDPHPDPRSIRPEISDSLVTIVDRALKKNADERYQTGAEMAADLKAYLGGNPIQAPPVKTAEAKSSDSAAENISTAPLSKEEASVKTSPNLQTEKTAPSIASSDKTIPGSQEDRTMPSQEKPMDKTIPLVSNGGNKLDDPQEAADNKTQAAGKTDEGNGKADSQKTASSQESPPGAVMPKIEDRRDKKFLDLEKTLPIINPPD